MIEVLKQALEALKDVGVLTDREWQAVHKNKANELRKAIADLESQEPVAWVQDVEFEQLPEFAFSWVKTRLHDKPLYTHPPQRTEQELVKTDDFSWIEDLSDYEPLGTVVGHISNSNYVVVLVNEGMVVDLEDDVFPEPQKQRTWVGLTDEEIEEGIKQSWVTEQAFQSAAWWAEAKLKEKNT
jgi:hypothetical protein